MDDLEVWVEVSEDIFSDDIGRLKDLRQLAEYEMRETLGIHARVKLVEPGSIERSTGKAKRVVDRRNVYDK
jgi:phenylacetate-CoA ligase